MSFFLFFNWSIVALQYCACLCCTEKWLSYIHIHLLFQYSFPLWFIPGDWIQFPVLYSRTLAFIHSPCNSLSLFLLSFFLLNSWVANESFESMGACSLSQSCLTLCDPMNPLVLCPWYFPAKNTGVGCCFLFQGSFLIQGSNLCRLHWHIGSYHWATWEVLLNLYST